MIRLELDRNIGYHSDHEKVDARRIVDVFNHRGYNICLIDALDAWQTHSSDMCAGWLNLPDEDEVLFEAVFHMFKEV